MSISAPRLRQSRHGVFVFRYLVPAAFVAEIGKKELRRSLGTKNCHTAKVIALQLNALIEKALKTLPPRAAMDEIKKLLGTSAHGWILRTKNYEFQTDGTKEDAEDLAERLTKGELRELIEQEVKRGSSLSVTPVTGPATGSLPQALHFMPARPMTIAQAIENYLKGKSAKDGEADSSEELGRESPKVSVDRKTTITIFEEFIKSGAREGLSLGSYVHELQADDIENFLRYYAKRTPQKLKANNKNPIGSGKDSASQGRLPEGFQDKAALENKVMSRSTLDKQSTNIKTLIDYCRKQGAIQSQSTLLSHHFRKDLRDLVVQLTKHNRKAGSYRAFEHQELKNLFEADTFFWCSGAQPDYFWAPLLALHMGFRAKEIATLTLKSVRDFPDQGLHAIQLFEDTTKNLNSSRIVPIPDRIVELGFLDYVNFLHEKTESLSQEEKAHYPLFPHVDYQSATFQSDSGKNISRFFSCYRRMPRFGLDLNTKVFHSFRHTVVSVLEAIKVDVKAQLAIVGHAEGDDGVQQRASEQWLGRAKALKLQTNLRYTKEVTGFDAPSSLQHNKEALDRCASMYELDYESLKLAAQNVRDLLVCQDLVGKKWRAGFRTNQQKVIATLPAALIPKDLEKVSAFDWR